MSAPRGLGVYLQRGGLARRTARRLRLAGVRHVALCAEAVSGWRATGAQLSSWAADARAEGLTVHVYSFPGSDAVQQPADVAAHLTASSLLVRASTAILDAEAPYQRRGPALRATLDACVAGSGGIPVAVTTLGAQSDRGTRWPWATLADWSRTHDAGWLGWQCYERAASSRARAGIAEHARTWGRARVLPHVALYERRTETVEGQDGGERLEADLRRVCLDERGDVDVPGVWLWSVTSLDDDEVTVLRRWSERWPDATTER